MKSKKTVKNAVLVAEVIESLKQRGAVDAKGIKEQIEKLIDKDYMERDENDKGLFHYVS
jgi:cullin-4